MNQERVEAAAQALATKDRANLSFWHQEEATEALAAADAVMFSNEAIERAAKALNAEHAPAWEILPGWVKDDWRKQVRTVVAALKGDA
ncbi:hypothetical protein J2T10_000089 [Paenarthrobacter nicotinovorans]|uniref:Uncharacterized protein n=1 Tax=Paenarthrobacter nicotinovorans TaxID=29320 RepID=A0ABT9TGC4_PAENI|nr:hypothetical protein [Paenarthrobacter nicotinovorans]MDQ0100470.1 hypothetical protein [Paenarthrobacter nicotinovorans]